MLRTDFTVVTLQHRVRLHPSSSGKEALPVFVSHDQEVMPRGTLDQSTLPRQRHLGLSQHDVLGDREVWTWATRQTTQAKDLTHENSLDWERWVCHASWAKGLVVLNLGIAFTADASASCPAPYFWCRAARNDTFVYLEIHKVGKSIAYPISGRRFAQCYAPLLVRPAGATFY